MAAMSTTRHAHAAGRRADVYGMAMGYEAAEPWRHVGSTVAVPGRGHIPAKPRARWVAALRRILISIAGR